jgi:hypothetical protein
VREGLLWFDPDKRRAPQEKLDQAAERYAQRLGRTPNLCQVNPADLFTHPTIRVVPNPAVLRGHLWVGRDEELEAAPRRKRKIA